MTSRLWLCTAFIGLTIFNPLVAQDKPAAEKLLAFTDAATPPPADAPEQAAWTMAANLLLNLDEAITKE